MAKPLFLTISNEKEFLIIGIDITVNILPTSNREMVASVVREGSWLECSQPCALFLFCK